MFKELSVTGAKSLQLAERAKSDASHELPRSDDAGISLAELTVVEYVSSHYNQAVGEIPTEELENNLQKNLSLCKKDGHQGQLSTLKGDFNVEFSSTSLDVKRAIETLSEAKRALTFFQKENNLYSEAKISTTGRMFWFWVGIAFMFTLEFATNASFIFENVDTGLIGAIGLTMAIAFINVFGSFLVGRKVLPYMFHIKSARRKKAIFAALGYVSFILYLNLSFGVFRALIADQQLDFTAATRAAVSPFSHLASLDFQSFVLIFVGLLFAIIAVLEGLFFDEIYPNYGDHARAVTKARDALDTCVKTGYQKLNLHQKKGNLQLTEFKNARENANISWASAVDRVQDLFNHYEIWVEGLESDGNALLQQYRSANKSYRSTSPPAYFNEVHSFKFQKDANKRFVSLASENISDKEKEEKIAAHAKVILSEYTESILDLNGFYEEKISNFERLIG